MMARFEYSKSVIPFSIHRRRVPKPIHLVFSFQVLMLFRSVRELDGPEIGVQERVGYWVPEAP